MPDASPAPVSRRYRWRRWLGEALLFLAVVAGIHLWQTRDTPGGPAPDIQGLLADGGSTSLAAWRGRHPGRAVLLHFWADWCPICKTTAGSVDAVGKDWPLLTVAMQSGPPPAIARHLQQAGHAWTTLADPDGQLTARYGLRGVPAFVVIDAANHIRFVEVGYTSEVGLRLRLWLAENLNP